MFIPCLYTSFSVKSRGSSLVSRTVNKRTNGFSNPAFHIHALQRGSRVSTSKKVKFALILTVTAPKAYTEIYENVLQKYEALAPMYITVEN